MAIFAFENDTEKVPFRGLKWLRKSALVKNEKENNLLIFKFKSQ